MYLNVLLLNCVVDTHNVQQYAVYFVNHCISVYKTEMSITRELMTTYSKTERFRKLFTVYASRSLNHKAPCVQQIFSHDKSFKLIANKPLAVHVQQGLQFSISTSLKSETMCAGDKNCLNVYYEDILEAQNDDDILIIDVREQSEIDQTGKLPGSIHIPMGNVTNVLQCLSKEDFKTKFARDKPSKDTKIILSCRSGKRSAMVQEEIQKLGYENSYNYVGGWMDWESHQVYK